MPVWEWGGTSVLVHPSPAAFQPQPHAKEGRTSPVPDLWLSHGRSTGGLVSTDSHSDLEEQSS